METSCVNHLEGRSRSRVDSSSSLASPLRSNCRHPSVSQWRRKLQTDTATETVEPRVLPTFGGVASSLSPAATSKVWSSVALQDHISRSLDLPRIHRTPRSHVEERNVCNQRCSATIAGIRPKRKKGTAHGNHQVVPVDPCLQYTDQVEELCLHFEGEYKQYCRSLTLAEKMGLVEKPPPPLSSGEWSKIQEKSNVRGDTECPICLSAFTDGKQQVILCCSHVYHEDCLNSYERHFGSNKCPMCRGANYYRRYVTSGVKAYKQQCAIRIQRYYRGYRVRKQMLKLMAKTIEKISPVNDNTEEWSEHSKQSNKKSQERNFGMLKRKYGAKALKALTSTLLSKIASKDEQVNDFLMATEYSQRQSMLVIESGLREMEQRREEAIRSSSQVGPLLQYFLLPTPPPPNEDGRSIVHDDANRDWEAVKVAAQKRDLDHCAICCQELTTTTTPIQKACGSKTNNLKTNIMEERKLVLLSCSHMFHKTCIDSFENFDLLGAAHKCPVCRESYNKLVL